MKTYLYLIVAISFGMNACQSETATTQTEPTTEVKETKNQTMEDTSTDNSLKALLDEKKANFNEKASDEKKRIYAEGIDAVANSGVLESAVQVGDEAPNFELINADNETVELRDLLAEGPVVLTWYRGGWCPYCNLTLVALQQELPNFKAEGAHLVALTPELPDISLATSEKNNLDFYVLSDVGNVVAKEYGVVFDLTPEVADAYQNGFGLHAYNGDESNQLPLAATYIINQNGKVTYAFLDPDYRNRAEPSEITAELKKLN